MNDGSFVGNLAILGYVMSTVAAGVIFKEVLREGINPIGLTNFSFILGFITLLPMVWNDTSFSFYSIISIPFKYQLGVWYMALVSGTIAFSLQTIAQKSIELSEAAVFMYLYPILSGILAIFAFGDKFNYYTAVGSVITVVGIIIAEIKKKRYNP
jgi:drug/metabolite transporter (DMT)-like permease